MAPRNPNKLWTRLSPAIGRRLVCVMLPLASIAAACSGSPTGAAVGGSGGRSSVASGAGVQAATATNAAMVAGMTAAATGSTAGVPAGTGAVGAGGAGVLAPIGGAPVLVAGNAAERDAGSPVASGEDAGDAVSGEAPDASTDGSVDKPDLDAGMTTRFPPFETNGEPLSGAIGDWTYTEFPDALCRDGSPAGVYVNLGSTKKLMIFLEGGGRCAEASTCAINPTSVASGGVLRVALTAGVLDRAQAENPVRDWNFVYVPYCTGDRHGGANPDADVPGVGPQKFVGHLNLKKFLNRIVPTFRDASDVLLTGLSAGGFGVEYNAVLVQRAFANVKLKLIIDSAPFVSTAVFTSCDQEQTRKFYRAEETFLGDCGLACPRADDYWMDFGMFLAKTFSDRPVGLISALEDSTERSFFGIGVNGCTASLDLVNPGIPAAAFRKDVLAYREQIAAFANFGTFYPDVDTHTWLGFPEFYTVRAGNVRLVDWFAKIANGQNAGHAGP